MNGVIGIIFQRRKHLIVDVGIPRADEYAFEERCAQLHREQTLQMHASANIGSFEFEFCIRLGAQCTYVYECAGCQRVGKPLISGNSDNLDAYAIITKKTERRRRLTGASANHPFLLPRTIPFPFLFLSKIRFFRPTRFTESPTSVLLVNVVRYSFYVE